jgi:protein-S-isoprenylcysteine O-methyltransferase Ste14
MIGEVSIYGIYVPVLLLLSLLSLAVTRGLSRILAWTGFYRVVWHPALFDFALFIIVLGVLNFISLKWF